MDSWGLFLNLNTYNYLLEPNITFNRSRFLKILGAGDVFENSWSRSRSLQFIGVGVTIFKISGAGAVFKKSLEAEPFLKIHWSRSQHFFKLWSRSRSCIIVFKIFC